MSTSFPSDFILDPALMSPPIRPSGGHISPTEIHEDQGYQHIPLGAGLTDIGNNYKRPFSPFDKDESRKRGRVEEDYAIPGLASLMHPVPPNMLSLASIDSAGPSTFPSSKPTENGSSSTTGKRAAQACLRCRKQKLRCLGGDPCARCLKAKTACEYGKPGSSTARHAKDHEAKRRSSDARESTSRLERRPSDSSLNQDENRIANLLVDLRGATKGNPHFQAELLKHLGDDTPAYDPSTSDSRHAIDPSLSSSMNKSLPPPTHSRPSRLPRFGNQPSDQSPGNLSTSPGNLSRHAISPSIYGSSVARGKTPSEVEEKAARESLYDAPFKELLYADPRSAPMSRRNSGSTLPYSRKIGGSRDDPINTGIVDQTMAEILFQFFIDNCHPFLPMVNVALDDAFANIRQSPHLFSAMLAIAARFYIRYVNRMPRGSKYPPLEPHVPSQLANLAETHLASTLLRKHYALSDVQAVLILAAWGLHSGGRGPDAWVVTGHAARIARRLGVHKILAHASDVVRSSEMGSEDWKRLEAFLPQWRSWLSWFGFDGFLTLGFGRPQSTQFETVDETAFLQIRLSKPLPRPGSASAQSLYGDVYIACQVQLTQIGRDLVNWGEMLIDPEKAIFADVKRAEMFHDTNLTLENMFKDLNGRLDDWYKEWMWSGSQYSMYLGPSSRIARLQGEHMRLCVNSYAMKSSSAEGDDEAVAPYLKKALNAATSTINAHFESSESDLALSFANDYLTIALSQAAMFLVRLTKAPQNLQTLIGLSSGMVTHYLRTAVDLLENADLSETRLSTYLGKKIKEAAQAAGLLTPLGSATTSHGTSAHVLTPPAAGPGQQEDQSALDASTVLPFVGLEDEAPNVSVNNGNGFDLDDFFALENELNLGYLLGLPGDVAGAGGTQTLNFGSGGTSGEFGWAMGGMGVSNVFE